MKEILFTFCLLALLLPAPVSSQVVQILQDNAPDEYANIETAIAFLREMGNWAEAGNVGEWLRNGRIYVDPDLPRGDDGRPDGSGNIYVNTQVAGSSRGRLSTFQRVRDLDNIARLALTLLHEKVHAHQSGLFISVSYISWYRFGGPNPAEVEAWAVTLYYLDQWVERCVHGTRPRAECILLLNLKIDYINDFYSRDYGEIFLDEQSLTEVSERLTTLRDRLESKETARKAEAQRGKEESGQLATQRIKEDLDRVEGVLGPALERLKKDYRLPRDDELLFSVAGLGRSAGDVLQMTLTNKTGEPIRVPMMAGSVMVPSDSAYQTIILSEDKTVAVPPRQTVTETLKGYGLEPDKRPPPRKGEKDAGYRLAGPGTHRLVSAPAPSAPRAKIIRAGTEKGPVTKSTAGDSAAWKKVAKGTLTDTATGQPLDGQVVVIPRGDGDTARGGDEPEIKPGDTLLVIAPGYEKKKYVVGKDRPPEQLSLDAQPLRFATTIADSAEALEAVKQALAKQGITLDPQSVEQRDIATAGGEKVREIIVRGSGSKRAHPDFAWFPPAGKSERNWIEADQLREGQQAADLPNDPFYRSKGSWDQPYDDQWGLKRIGLSVWPEKGQPVTVAVIDSGMDRLHPDLLPAIWINEREIPGNGKDDDNNGYVDDVFGWNFVDHNNDTRDNNGHGTFVAGIIAAWANNGVGIAGVNPWARIMPIKVTDFNNKGWSIDIAKAIIYAVNNGARVINISIGGKRLTKVEQVAIDYANAKGAVVVVASGNQGTNTNDFSPAGLRGVITVASTDTSDKRVGFSNWGRRVAIAAPGVDILSLRAQKTDLLLLESKDYKPGTAFVGKDKRYYRTAGSSFSAPFVAGVASLILTKNSTLTGEQVKRMILYSARDIDVPGKDQYTGYGLLDAKAALAADPAFFLETDISEVRLVKQGAAMALEINGTADADRLKQAWIEIGAGSNPSQWRPAVRQITRPVQNGPLGNVPVALFKGAQEWVIRLIAEHQNGERREARYTLKLQ